MRWGFFCICLCVSASLAQTTRPNIVIIMTDDQRWDSLGCAGHPFLKTPNIDRIAREGAMFQNYFVTLPLCAPSRAAILTGQYAHTNGVKDNGNSNALSHQLITWPRLLHDSGYETAFIGKIHMGNDATPRPGFDRWISFKGQGVYTDLGLNIDGKPQKVNGYITDLLSGYAVDFIKKKHDKPFAMCLFHKAIHGPFTPADRHKDLYKGDPLPQPPNLKDDLSGKPILTRKTDPDPPGHPGHGQRDERTRDMLRCIVAIDEGVGDIFKALEETGQLDNTILIYTSDNGYFFGEHGLGDKRAAYEESIRDPLLIRYPKLVKAGSKPEQMVLNVDIAPTLLELAGAPVPKSMQGQSLAPILKGDAKGRDSILLEYFAEPRSPTIPTWHAVRTKEWMYIRYDELQGMDEMYDLKNDPYEMKNLIKDETSSGKLKELRAELKRLEDEIK